MHRPTRTLLSRALILVYGFFLTAPPAHATDTGGNLPWDNILQTLADSVQGPVFSALIVMGIVAGGAYWFFSDNQRGLVQIVKALIVGGIVTGLTGFLTTLGITPALV